MYSYISEIEHLIELQIKNSESNIVIIRLEGFDSPIIYKEICKNLETYNNVNISAKLSKEKNDEFRAINNSKWNIAFDFLEKNNYIDTAGAMTKWRNNSTELAYENNKKHLVLLMGTESVQDKGGLVDFYSITPETILRSLKNSYSKWFKDILRDNNIDDEYYKSLDTFFKVLFKNVNVNLVALSDLANELSDMVIPGIDEMIQEICLRLNKYWGIPNIVNDKSVPKGKKLKEGKLSSASIIEKSFGFINRIPFAKGIKEKALKKYEEKIDRYAEENSIDFEDKFPEENPIFDNYTEFKYSLLDYIQGKNYAELKKKFIEIDYSIIDKLLSLKVDAPESKTKENKETNIFGDPIEVYLRMILKVILDYKSEYKEMPDVVDIKVNSTRLTDCLTEEEEKQSYYNICCRLGGVVGYINNMDNELICECDIRYINNIDPFCNEIVLSDKSDIVVTRSENMNELSKISFTIKALDAQEENKREREYIYCFSHKDEWVSDFILLNKINLEDLEMGGMKLPFYTECSNLNDLVNCESDDEFFIKLQKIKTNIISSEYQSDLFQFNDSNISNEFGHLINDYKNFVESLNDYGFYSTLTNKRYISRLCNRYSNWISVVKDNYDNLTSTQKEYISFVLDVFLIGDKPYDRFKVEKCNTVLLPPYHPTMLEKLHYKEEYMKKSFEECILGISDGNVISEKVIDKKLESATKMCHINSGLDVYALGVNRIVDAEVIHGKYAVYNLIREDNLISDKVISVGFEVEDDVSRNQLIRKTYKSDIICENIVDYIKTFPARIDGLNVLFINPDDMQHIVAGIHSAIEIIGHISLNVRILVPFSRRNGAGYLKYWLDNCFENQDEAIIKTYLNYADFNNCNIQDKLDKLINEEDLTYFYNVFNETSIDFAKISGQELKSDIKYPATYTPIPICITQETRKIDISQRQFNSSNEHLQLTHKYLRPNEVDDNYRAIKILQLNDRKKELINFIHEKSRWVVCLDESIDKNIINEDNRKIIGFSTGKGIFGELNTTVSARNDVLVDLQKKLMLKLMLKFDKWLPEVAAKAANNCIEISKNLDGSKMLKALNPRDCEIHNYLAYVLTMQSMSLYKEKEEYVIRTLINLDNYLHWFDDTLSKEYMRKEKIRPDFLILEIQRTPELFERNKQLKIKATVVECKMGKENESYIVEARNQIISGLNVLANNFSSSNNSVNRRYWFNQLYRALVFSKINMKDNGNDYDILIDKISDIYNGNFEIEWNGSVYAYWSNVNDDKHNVVNLEKPEDVKYSLNNFDVHTFGQILIQKLLLPSDLRNDIELEYTEEKEIETSEFKHEVLDGENDFSSNMESINNTEDTKESSEISLEIKDRDNIKELSVHTYGESEYANEEDKQIVQDSDKIKLENEEKSNHIRFLLGEDLRTKEKIYWEYTHKELNNRHLLINGNSGCGKTYCIQTLILEATMKGISVIVFDYTDGFTKSKLSPVLLEKLGDKFESRLVKYKKFPINPFKKGKVYTEEGEEDELAQDVANRIAASFTKVYGFGEQQMSAIYSAVREGIEEYGESMTLEILKDNLEQLKNKSAATVVSKILPLVDYKPFMGDTDFAWSNIVDAKGMMYVIQLSGYTREIQVILTELILWDIWNYAVKYGSESTPIPLVLDEAQNLSHDENSPSGKILAEGRKFGLSGWYATQFMAGRLSAGEIGNLQQSAQKLYFSPPEKSIMEIAKYIDVTNEGSKSWAEKLSKLNKGYCVTSGFKAKGDKFSKYEPRIIKISSLEDRMND